MEVPRLGVKLQLQLPAYTTATATPNLSMSATNTIAHGNAGSFNPMNKAGDQTCIFIDTSHVLNLLSQNRFNSPSFFFFHFMVEMNGGANGFGCGGTLAS